MLTRENFIELISKLKDEDEKVEKLEVSLTEYYRDSGFVFRCNGYSAAIINLLKFSLSDDIDLLDWWYHEAYPNYLESGDIKSISNFNNDGSIDGTFRTSGDVFDYLQERRTKISKSKKIGEKEFVEIVNLIIEEDIAEEKINIALDIFGIDNKRESGYWIILMSLLKETIDPNEHVKWWTEAMYEYRKNGERSLNLITITNAENNEYIIKTSAELYEFLGKNEIK